MSSWQSFFNQLTRPAKEGMLSSTEIICICKKGKLIIEETTTFKASGACELENFCSIIQMDRYRAITKKTDLDSIVTNDMYSSKNNYKQKSLSFDEIL
jgi:hypothetical protein